MEVYVLLQMIFVFLFIIRTYLIFIWVYSMSFIWLLKTLIIQIHLFEIDRKIYKFVKWYTTQIWYFLCDPSVKDLIFSL